ncbi:hypothetical protein EMN47_00370 [Prolixibacteraceae bacterium JC049]|nr:hypothetical protein [Prolixibacteraceae bacterium JC049]
MELSFKIIQFVWVIEILPLVLGLIKFKSLSQPLKIIVLHLVFVALFEVGSRLMRAYYGNNLPLLHLYTIEEFIMLGLFFKSILEDYIPRNWIVLLISGFVSYSLVNSLFIQSLYMFNNFARGIESLLIIALAILYFIKVLNRLDIKKVTKEPLIWINTGILFYFSANLFNFILSNLALKVSSDLSRTVWLFHGIFIWLLYILIAVGLWLVPKKHK